MKKQKGITLTALVITIIVMLILVVVVISFASRDEGILKNAKTASAETEKKAILEELISIAVINNDDGTINARETADKAIEKYGADKAEYTLTNGEYLVTITGKSGTSYTYTITANGIKIGDSADPAAPAAPAGQQDEEIYEGAYEYEESGVVINIYILNEDLYYWEMTWGGNILGGTFSPYTREETAAGDVLKSFYFDFVLNDIDSIVMKEDHKTNIEEGTTFTKNKDKMYSYNPERYEGTDIYCNALYRYYDASTGEALYLQSNNTNIFPCARDYGLSDEISLNYIFERENIEVSDKTITWLDGNTYTLIESL